MCTVLVSMRDRKKRFKDGSVAYVLEILMLSAPLAPLGVLVH